MFVLHRKHFKATILEGDQKAAKHWKLKKKSEAHSDTVWNKPHLFVWKTEFISTHNSRQQSVKMHKR